MSKTPEAMQGLGCCRPGTPCKYHATKVPYLYTGSESVFNGSTFPPSKVWGKEYLEELAHLVEDVPDIHGESSITEKVHSVLSSVDDYWRSNGHRLNVDLYKAWEDWNNSSKLKKKYPAGGWAASPQQLSQLVETIKLLKKEKNPLDNYLRVGTASGVHTQQEVLALALAGIKKPGLTVIDTCFPPLFETLQKAKTSIVGVSLKSILNPPAVWSGKWNIITTHFLESFLPTQEQFEYAGMKHEDSLRLKGKFFSATYNLLSDPGVFIMTFGTSADERRCGSEEMKELMVKSGFIEKQIIITPTSDPLDYVDGKYLPGNYFAVAVKGVKYP